MSYRLNLISLFSIFVSFNIAAQSHANTINIYGVVKDYNSKEVLIGASIHLSGTSIGTQSNIKGEFKLILTHVNQNDSLIITYVGYQKMVKPLHNLNPNDTLRINLINQSTVLKEVIVHSEFWLKQYSPSQLREDYTKFCTIMEKVHTGLYDYFPQNEWQAMKDSISQLCKFPMSHSEFYRIIALQVGRVRNVHTKHGVTDWWYKQKQNIFPFNINYFDERMFVSESLVKEIELSKGTEILEINGKSPNEIKAMIWPFIPADGFIQTQKLCTLNDYFPWFYSLFVEEANGYNMKVRLLDGKVKSITNPGLRDSFAHLSFQQVWKHKKSTLELTIDEKMKAAYFRIEDSRAFKDSIKSYFQRIHNRGIEHLIIDLRGEGGIREGEHVVELYSYLVYKPFRAYEKLEVKSNDWTLFDKDFTYKPYANSLKEIREGFFDKLVASGDGSYLFDEGRLKQFDNQPDNNFTGKVYILTDGRNYSASTSFTSLAAQLDNVYIIGEETGGEYRSYVSGAMFRLVLPNSKIGVKVATFKSTLAIKEDPLNRGRGVMPDYPVSITLDDFIKGRDVVKDFAFELIAIKR